MRTATVTIAAAALLAMTAAPGQAAADVIKLSCVYTTAEDRVAAAQHPAPLTIDTDHGVVRYYTDEVPYWVTGRVLTFMIVTKGGGGSVHVYDTSTGALTSSSVVVLSDRVMSLGMGWQMCGVVP